MTRGTITLTDFTHYQVLKRETWVDPVWVRIFVMDECETCGGPVAAANSLQIEIHEDQLTKNGLKVWSGPLIEGWHDEATGMEVCDNCPRRDA